MAILKPISGHNTLVNNHIRDYILGTGVFYQKYKGSRCEKMSYINLKTPWISNNDKEIYWDKEMDDDRHKTNKDKQKKDKRVCHYLHYIFSPAPQDNVTVEELDSALKEWCERVFQNKFSIAIGYHNDNTNHVQHAHMIINNVNWDIDDPRTTISWYTDKKCWEYASQLWQYMCKERGWYSFIEKQKADLENTQILDTEINKKEGDYFTQETEHLYKIDENYFKEHKFYNPNINYKRPYHFQTDLKNIPLKCPLSTKQNRKYTKGQEMALKRGEKLWVDDIRNCLEISYQMSENEKSFIKNLENMGISTELTQNLDWKYSHPKNSQHRVTGAKLGRDYTRKNILWRFAHPLKDDWKPHRSVMPDKEKYQWLSKVSALAKEEKIIYINAKNNTTTLSEIATTMRVCNWYNSWDKSKLNSIKQQLQTDKEINGITTAISTIEKLDNISLENLTDFSKQNVSSVNAQRYINAIKRAEKIKKNGDEQKKKTYKIKKTQQGYRGIDSKNFNEEHKSNQTKSSSKSNENNQNKNYSKGER